MSDYQGCYYVMSKLIQMIIFSYLRSKRQAIWIRGYMTSIWIHWNSKSDEWRYHLPEGDFKLGHHHS